MRIWRIGSCVIYFNIVLLCSFHSSCTSDDLSNPKIRIINASPDASSVDFYLNKQIKIRAISFGSASNYIISSPGDIAISAVQPGQNRWVVYTSIGLQDNQFYTFVIDDSIKSIIPYILVDNRQTPASGKAGIRFLHLVKNSDNYNISNDNSVVFSNRTFNDVMGTTCDYQTITAGQVILDFRLAGNSSILFSTPKYNYESGRLYTIVAYGSGTPGLNPNFTVFNDN